MLLMFIEEPCVTTDLSIAFSPCPNDTFIFHGLVNQKVAGAVALNPTYLDIAHLNELILGKSSRQMPDVCKVSFAVLPEIMEDYVALPVGAALGFENGPKLVASQKLSIAKLADLKAELGKAERGVKRVVDFALVSPGPHTTAMHLFNRFYSNIQPPSYSLYDQIESQLVSGVAEVGLIIHETRFTLEGRGLVELVDLGQMWQRAYDLPLPLGCIVAKRSLGAKFLERLIRDIKASIQYSRDNPTDGLEYILENSIEKNPNVLKSHIDLYVNQESSGLSPTGIKAVETLLGETFQTQYGVRSAASSWLQV